MKPFLFFAFTFIFGFLPHFAQATSPQVGTVSVARNDVFVKHPGQETEIKVALNTPVYLGDTFITKDDQSFVKIDFVDETHITMNGMDASLTIDQYIFDPAKLEGNKATFSILKGSFEFVGGLIDKGEEENTQINLDFGSIGVRGTKLRRSMKDGECWIYLEDGAIRVFNDGGETFLKPGDGTRMGAKTKAPTDAKPWSQENIDWILRVTTLPQ